MEEGSRITILVRHAMTGAPQTLRPDMSAAVGETIQDVSASGSTREMSEHPERGTPERVRERRGT
jgi:hypothetical protein